jgi:hypothetical protein
MCELIFKLLISGTDGLIWVCRTVQYIDTCVFIIKQPTICSLHRASLLKSASTHRPRTHHSALSTPHSPLCTHCPALTTPHSPLPIKHQIYRAHHSAFTTAHSPQLPHHSALTTLHKNTKFTSLTNLHLLGSHHHLHLHRSLITYKKQDKT